MDVGDGDSSGGDGRDDVYRDKTEPARYRTHILTIKQSC